MASLLAVPQSMRAITNVAPLSPLLQCFTSPIYVFMLYLPPFSLLPALLPREAPPYDCFCVYFKDLRRAHFSFLSLPFIVLVCASYLCHRYCMLLVDATAVAEVRPLPQHERVGSNPVVIQSRASLFFPSKHFYCVISTPTNAPDFYYVTQCGLQMEQMLEGC